MWQIISGVLGFALVISLVFNFAGGSSGSGSGTIVKQPTQNAGSGVEVRSDVDLEGVYFLGKENAPVKIIEFSDFQCPFCGRHYSQSHSQLVKEYVDTGKAVFYYKHFPLSFHPEAYPAALAYECAGEQDKNWEMHDKIFENQDAMSEASYKQWANDLGLNTAKFNECFDSDKYKEKIDADFNEGQELGVSGTPSFFINGVKVVGAQPYSAFKQVIDAELS